MHAEIEERSIELLRYDPQQLILSMQDMIGIIVYRFIRAGKFHVKERQDIVQHINEELIRKIPKIQTQFKGNARIKTYFAAIITNICHEIIRKTKKIDYINITENFVLIDRSEVTSNLVIQDEIKNLQKILALYFRQRSKLVLLLKLKFRIPVNFSDLHSVFEDLTMTEYRQFLQDISPYEENTDLQMHTALTGLFNHYGSRSITPDALRKWIKQKITELIDILNGNPPVSKYTEETLQILFENCLFAEQEKEVIIA